jgi:hypothetical protein
VQPYACSACSLEAGYPYSRLVQGLLSPIEADHKLIGGEIWWLCARCHQPKFFVRALR